MFTVSILEPLATSETIASAASHEQSAVSQNSFPITRDSSGVDSISPATSALSSPHAPDNQINEIESEFKSTVPDESSPDKATAQTPVTSLSGSLSPSKQLPLDGIPHRQWAPHRIFFKTIVPDFPGSYLRFPIPPPGVSPFVPYDFFPGNPGPIHPLDLPPGVPPFFPYEMFPDNFNPHFIRPLDVPPFHSPDFMPFNVKSFLAPLPMFRRPIFRGLHPRPLNIAPKSPEIPVLEDQ